MKANELMIGDLVRVTNRIAKVHDIGKIVGVEFVDGGYDVFKIEELEPIPLTAEILEKNGIKWFCTEPSGRKTYCCNESVIQCTYIPNSGWLINVGACGSIKVRFVEISKIQYVHELQHALRLCGIEKEIEL